MGPFTPGEYFWLIALGFGVGVYGTLIGAGGGFILMPLLLLMHPNASPEHLTSISLAVVFFNAFAGSESYAVMGRIDFKSGLMFAAPLFPGQSSGRSTPMRCTGGCSTQFLEWSSWPPEYFYFYVPRSKPSKPGRVVTTPMSIAT